MTNERLMMLLEIAADEQPGAESSGVAEGAADTSVAEAGTEGTEQPAEESVAEETPQEFEIDGEKLTLDQLREFKKGYMRQSDYTKKTQRIAQEKEENREARELYDFLKQNPEIAKKLAELAPEQAERAQKIVSPEIQDIKMQLATMEIDTALEKIKSRDKDVDEMAVLNIAIEENISVEKAYKQWKGENFDNLLKKKLEEQSKNLTKKIQTNKEKTQTLISPKAKPIDNFGLSDKEIEMASKLGMDMKEYAQWKRK